MEEKNAHHGQESQEQGQQPQQQPEAPNFRGMFEGATLTNCTQNFIWGNKTVHVHSNREKPVDAGEQPAKELTKERLARAVENCQEYFWGNSAYAVLYCILRDDYKQKDLSRATYERMVELLPYTKTREHTCPVGTIDNAFRDNPIFSSPIGNWDALSVQKRIIKLRDELRKQLKL